MFCCIPRPVPLIRTFYKGHTASYRQVESVGGRTQSFDFVCGETCHVRDVSDRHIGPNHFVRYFDSFLGSAVRPTLGAALGTTLLYSLFEASEHALLFGRLYGVVVVAHDFERCLVGQALFRRELGYLGGTEETLEHLVALEIRDGIEEADEELLVGRSAEKEFETEVGKRVDISLGTHGRKLCGWNIATKITLLFKKICG